MKLIEKYNKTLNAIYEHVGFVPDWVIYPIDDRTKMYWQIVKNKYGDTVKFTETLKAFHSNGDFYSDEIDTQRFYEQWIYRGEELTMLFVDTHTDGNKFFAIFDNQKEVKGEK